MQDQKKQEKLVKKPQKLVPQEVEVAPTDNLEAEIAMLVQKSSGERLRDEVFRQEPDYLPRTCSFGCSCMPCRQGMCGSCSIDSIRRVVF